jgi:hypothetical protein
VDKTEQTLNDAVRSLIVRVLGEVPAASGLIEQTKTLTAAGPITMLQLKPGAGASPVAIANGPLPVRAIVKNENGARTGELIIWIEDGLLDVLEYAWVTHDAPTSLPRIDQILLVKE